MLQSAFSYHNDVVSFASRRPARRLHLSRPMAALVTVALVFASGVVVGQFDHGHGRAAPHAQSQPFDHFPR